MSAPDVTNPVVNDLGPCRHCNSKPERDLIRVCDRDYSATAFLPPDDKHEALKERVIPGVWRGIRTDRTTFKYWAKA